MMVFATAVFCFSVLMVLYTYVGYVLVLQVLPKTKVNSIEVSATDELPSVTMIIAAYNEEKFIHEKIKNALAVDYPERQYRVVVVSDGSDDATNKLVNEFDDNRLSFIELTERGGKANALTCAMQSVSSDYVVFTDANVFLSKDAIRKLVCTAEAPGIGAVTGRVELESLESREPLGESAYMKYERYIQALESKFWSVVGVDGALFIVRRELVRKIPKDTVLDDFTTGVNVALSGSRVLYEPDACAVEQVPAEVKQEFRRKTRIAAGCFQFLSRLDWREFVLSPIRFRFAFLSHKVIRWYVPFFLVLALLSNVVLAGSALFQLTLILQLTFYFVAILTAVFPPFRQLKLAYIAYYFVAMNLAFMTGWLRHKRDRQSVTWNRVDR
jgi:poly-beta-1,6-N-acetyl-D-glucosamine synthase